MISLPPQEFTFGKYDCSIIPTDIYLDDVEFVKWLGEQVIIGYCRGSDLSIRPRDGEFGVMFEEDNWQGWCHVPDFVFNKFLKGEGYV